MPTLRRSGGSDRPGDATCLPSIAMLPARTGSKPATARNTVVLPQPEAPSRQPIAPRSSESDRPSTTRRSPPPGTG